MHDKATKAVPEYRRLLFQRGKTMIRNHTITTTLAGAAGVLCAVLAGVLQAAERPDFTGAWTTYRGTGGAGAFSAPGGAQPKYKPEAQKAIADFRSVTEGTNHGAGNSCVGSGMPASIS